MNPIAEKIFRALAMGRGKYAALVRAGLEADGIVVAEDHNLSMSPSAVRKRREREKRRVGSDAPVTSSVTVTPDVTPSLSLSSSNLEIQERERDARTRAGAPVTPPVTPVTDPVADEFPKESASSVRPIQPARRSRERDNVRDVTRTPKSRVTATDALTEDLVAIARDAGVDDPVPVWRKYTAFRDGQDRELAKDWRLWCLRERGQPSATTNKETASEPPVPRANEGPVVLIPESECASVEETLAHAAKLRETLAKAGYGGVRKARIPPPPLLAEVEDERREAAQ